MRTAPIRSIMFNCFLKCPILLRVENSYMNSSSSFYFFPAPPSRVHQNRLPSPPPSPAPTLFTSRSRPLESVPMSWTKLDDAEIKKSVRKGHRKRQVKKIRKEKNADEQIPQGQHVPEWKTHKCNTPFLISEVGNN